MSQKKKGNSNDKSVWLRIGVLALAAIMFIGYIIMAFI